jgi:hypothetical protein
LFAIVLTFLNFFSAHVNVGDAEGRTPLYLCCGSPLSMATEYQTTIVVGSLLSHGASTAIKVGHLAVIQCTIQPGASHAILSWGQHRHKSRTSSGHFMFYSLVPATPLK